MTPCETPTSPPVMLRSRAGWVSGVGLVVSAVAMAALAFKPDFAYGVVPAAEVIGTMVGLYAAGGVVYLAAVWGLVRGRMRPAWWWIVVVGTAMRAAFLFPPPMLEGDFYRYLWDGAVTSNGINPYAYAPSAANGPHADDVPPRVRELAAESGVVIHRVNPEFRTIYPIVAQASFALAHVARPWSLVAWRLVLLVFDSVTLLLIVRLLGEAGRPTWLAAIYWWNPLVVKEIFNSAHMDALIFPFVLAAILASVRARYINAAVWLALAVATKVWPILLLPILLRPLWGSWRRLAAAVAVFAVVGAILWIPVVAGGLDHTSGFVAYGGQWYNNSALFLPLTRATERTAAAVGLTVDPDNAARVVLVLAVTAWVAWLTIKPARRAAVTYKRCLLAVAGLFLLSPTQFPWYFTWLVPLLALSPRLPLLLYTVLLPLYYLKWWFSNWPQSQAVADGLVVMQHIPVWVAITAGLAAGAWRRHRRRPSVTSSSAKEIECTRV